LKLLAAAGFRHQNDGLKRCANRQNSGLTRQLCRKRLANPGGRFYTVKKG
jgi:hypothetical protein